MTVAALASQVSYIEDGVTTSFTAPFRYKNPSDLVVDRLSPDGSIAPLPYETAFTATDGDTDAGGTVTPSTLSTGTTLRIRRKTARAQTTEYETGGRFPAKTTEGGFDVGILIAQEQDAAHDNLATRALVVPDGETGSTLPPLADRIGALLVGDGYGNLIAGFTIAQINAAIANAQAAQNNQGLASAVIFDPGGAGASFRPIQNVVREKAISLADYGYVGDWNGAAGTDDTNAWRLALVAALLLGVGEIIVPWGVTGQSLVLGQVVNGALPPGLTFKGAGRNAQGDFTAGVSLVYGGAGTCWNIDQGDALPETNLRLTFRRLGFRATQLGAHMFKIGNPDQYLIGEDPNPDVTPNDTSDTIIKHVRFESCTAIGPAGETTGTGNFLMAAKTFEIQIDESCEFSQWFRGIHLIGCDNANIAARLHDNCGNYRDDRSGTFGNGNKLSSRYCSAPKPGPAPIGDVPPSLRYAAYMAGSGSRIDTVGLECSTPFTTGETAIGSAMLIIDGYKLVALNPQFAANGNVLNPIFRLGPNARQSAMYSPSIAGYYPFWAPTIDDPAGYDWGDGQNDYRMMIIDADGYFQQLVGSEPRISYVVPRKSEVTIADPIAPLVTTAGTRESFFFMDALTWRGKSRGLFVADSILGFIDDRASRGGKAIYVNNTALAGFAVFFVIGRDFLIADHIILDIIGRVENNSPSGNWLVGAERRQPDGTNTSYGSAQILTLGSEVHELTRIEYDLSGLDIGDTLAFYIYPDIAALPNGRLILQSMKWSVGVPAVAPLSNTATGTEIATAVNALINNSRRLGQSGGAQP